LTPSIVDISSALVALICLTAAAIWLVDAPKDCTVDSCCRLVAANSVAVLISSIEACLARVTRPRRLWVMPAMALSRRPASSLVSLTGTSVARSPPATRWAMSAASWMRADRLRPVRKA